MNENLYSRNRIYITAQEQETIKNYPILLAGCGIGSNIAECILRLGFEKITIIDGDQVEKSNLNRQNYVINNIGQEKVNSIKERLLAINPNAQIKIYNQFINSENINEFLKDCKIAVNALDFDSDIPLLFDVKCQSLSIPVLHPYNLGWASLVAIIQPQSLNFSSLQTNKEKINEIVIVEFFLKKLKEKGTPTKWLENIVEKYLQEDASLPPPQLSVGSWLVAAICSNILFRIATGKDVKIFPEFYYLGTAEN
ncbi:ThiF family adenylyltransferase [Empedobacter stercoris]|uniref:ThiF family adenylyltransferase n=1 Tax=Empedobacter stercoris TaxID=1628248 RepID=UPI0021AEC47A|nr:ThiF family adenylyltransferase [Empedobacter stercoris]UWX66213.1 ThiF family adenylyltransferase [Empedobacter stercoris]